MKKILPLFVMTAVVIFAAAGEIESSGKDVHFFESAICPACKKASDYFNSPANRGKFAGVNIVKYELMNSSGSMNAVNKRNLRTLVSMLESIKRKKGEEPFIFHERLAYGYYTKNGMPYYIRQERYSRKDEPMPVPMFIVGDKVLVGFSPFVSREIEKYVK